MSRPKRGSKVLDRAQRRIAGLKSISPTLDLGNGVTIDNRLSFREILLRRIAVCL
ncbi:hypothetical protein [uncultured Nostoc sp.]|uniref:hypothetical protein n=1 Tax=uncultured Nostoc sp. TaxID=340711 RepID=UPI0035CB35DB